LFLPSNQGKHEVCPYNNIVYLYLILRIKVILNYMGELRLSVGGYVAMNDKETTVSELKEKNAAFVKSRKWDGENAKDLSMALAIEAAELMEIFAWLHSDDADDVKANPKEFKHLKEEIADVFLYLIRMCEHFGIDLSEAVEEKMAKNAIKYPVNYRDLR